MATIHEEQPAHGHPMIHELKELKAEFDKFNQGHVFSFAEAGQLSEKEQRELHDHLKHVDVPYMAKSFKAAQEYANAASAKEAKEEATIKKSESKNIIDVAMNRLSVTAKEVNEDVKKFFTGRKSEAPPPRKSTGGDKKAVIPEPLSGVLKELPAGKNVTDPERELSKEEADKLRDLAFHEIAEGKVAALLLAGGQGTRLGSANPKGMFDGLGLACKKSLFQLQAERILSLEVLASEKTGLPKAFIPWYVMCSDATLENTQNYFQEMNFFGLSEKNVFFFKQRSVPALTPDGKFILESKTELAQAPNGNGGIYPALGESGALHDMKKRGIEHIHVFGVDNILVQVCDPLFIGLCITKKAEAGCKVVAKARPEEEIGVFTANYEVIEYSELGHEMAQMRLENGELAFNAGNICNHYYSVDFLGKVATAVDEGRLPYHIAKKKIPFLDTDGSTKAPKDKNGIKLELFIFDVFNAEVKMAFLEVPRDKEFAAVKNSEWKDPKNPVEPSGLADSPKTAREALWALHRSWLESAGAKIEGAKDTACEISPLVSYNGERLESYNGKTITLPFQAHPVKPVEDAAPSGVNCAGGKCNIM